MILLWGSNASKIIIQAENNDLTNFYLSDIGYSTDLRDACIKPGSSTAHQLNVFCDGHLIISRNVDDSINGDTVNFRNVGKMTCKKITISFVNKLICGEVLYDVKVEYFYASQYKPREISYSGSGFNIYSLDSLSLIIVVVACLGVCIYMTVPAISTQPRYRAYHTF